MLRVEYVTMVELSEGTWQRVKMLFPADQWVAVEQLLMEQCGDNLPRYDNATPEKLEQVRFAALKLSEGSMDRLSNAVELGKQDWRDLLMAARFGSDIHAHEQWWPERSGLRTE